MPALHHLRRWWFLLPVVLVLFLVDLGTDAVMLARAGRGLAPLREGATRTLLVYLVYALLAPALLAWAARFPVTEPHRARNIVIHLVAAPLFVLTHAVAWTGSMMLTGLLPDGATPADMIEFAVIRVLTFGLVMYAGVVAAYHAVTYSQELRERELRASRLETALASAELEVLRMQLQPHFLFNTLHGISSLMEDDVPAARRMMRHLAELLRMALARDGAQEVPLADELHFLRRYLELQQMRFGARLRVEYDVEPAAEPLLVPRLLLQPLVENAIRHGVSRRPGAGQVRVRAWCRQHDLHLAVEDDGAGLGESGAPGSGIGLANTRARLARLYGDRHDFAILARPEGGVCVEICLPAREGAPGAVGAVGSLAELAS